VAGVQSRRILVVDDDEHFLEFMQVLLTGEGYDVLAAATVADAEASIRAGRPDVVICDLWMPDAPPFALVDRLAGSIGIIVCTGAQDQAAEARTHLAGRRADVLLKPFDIDDLLACITRVLGAGE
jgi:two-component system KDP operon response regulator KdpE